MEAEPGRVGSASDAGCLINLCSYLERFIFIKIIRFNPSQAELSAVVQSGNASLCWAESEPAGPSAFHQALMMMMMTSHFIPIRIRFIFKVLTRLVEPAELVLTRFPPQAFGF